MAEKVIIAMPGTATPGNIVVPMQSFTMNNTSIGENMDNQRKADVELIQFFFEGIL
jgi:hypothetical protein